MKIGTVSKSLGVPAPTVRRWTREFQDGLHPDAYGGDGRPRAFTPRDLRLLRRAKELLAEGLSYDQTRRQLRTEGLLNREPAQPADAATGPESAAEREAAERYVAGLFERFIGADRARIAELEQSVTQLRRELASLTVELDRARLSHTPPSPGSASSPVRPESEPPRRTWPFR